MNTLELEIQEARAQDVRVDENVLAVDLTVAGILAGRHSNESAESLKKWLTSRPSAIKQPVRQVAEKKARYRK